MSTAVVIGGGISGLASCYYLQRTAKFSKIILLEASSRLGGWVHSVRHEDGAIFELGPRSLRPAGPAGRNTLELVSELGIAEDVIGVPLVSESARNRFLYVNGQRSALPVGLMGVMRKLPPFSKPLFWSGIQDLRCKPTEIEDESIYDFVDRHFGDEVAKYAADAFCRGIFAGDCRKLSSRSCLPPFYQADKKAGSLIRAGLDFSGPRKADSDMCTLVLLSLKKRWQSYSFKRGMQQLVETLTEAAIQKGGVEIQTGMPCSKITFDEGKALVEVNGETIKADHVVSSIYAKGTLLLGGHDVTSHSVEVNGETIKADHVVSSIYAKELSHLLPEQPDLSDQLRKISAVHAVVVCVEYAEDLNPKPKGFGHLLPSCEDGKFLGVVYDSCSFPELNRHSGPSTRFTVMMGGDWWDELVSAVPDMSEEGLKTLALQALQKQLNISATPSKVQVAVNKDCIPQYFLGHYKILDNLSSYINNHQLPLSLVGSSYKGPAVNECINNARLNVEAITGTSIKHQF